MYAEGVQPRQRRGTSTGGQFASCDRPDETPATLKIDEGDTPEEAFQDLRCLGEMHIRERIRLVHKHGEWMDRSGFVAPRAAVSKSQGDYKYATRCTHCGEWLLRKGGSLSPLPDVFVEGPDNPSERWRQHRRQLASAADAR